MKIILAIKKNLIPHDKADERYRVILILSTLELAVLVKYNIPNIYVTTGTVRWNTIFQRPCECPCARAISSGPLPSSSPANPPLRYRTARSRFNTNQSIFALHYSRFNDPYNECKIIGRLQKAFKERGSPWEIVYRLFVAYRVCWRITRAKLIVRTNPRHERTRRRFPFQYFSLPRSKTRRHSKMDSLKLA